MQQTTLDFDDDAKTTRKSRLGVVFGVGYYRSGERHGERFEIGRGAHSFPNYILRHDSVGRENYTMMMMMSKRDLHFVARKTTFFFFNSSRTKRPPPPPTPARALSSEGEKRGRRRRRRRRRRRKPLNGLDGFDLIFLISTTMMGVDVCLSSNRIRLFFPFKTTQKR